MPKGKNHYVPQLYLRHFSSKPRKIHVHHIRSGRSIFDVGLRDQCQRHKFYGSDAKVEDRLAEFEGEIAPILNRIINSQILPNGESRDYSRVLSFLALQLVRTPSSIDDFSEGAERCSNWHSMEVQKHRNVSLHCANRKKKLCCFITNCDLGRKWIVNEFITF